MGVGAGSGALNIWVKLLDRGPFTRLSFGGQDRRPFWSPDGRTVAFIRDSTGTSIVHARPADGSGEDRRLFRLDRQVQEATWSPDGRWIVVRTDNGQLGAADSLAVRTSGDTVPVAVAATPFTELHPAIAPDGRWVAYTSNESGMLTVATVSTTPTFSVGTRTALFGTSTLYDEGFHQTYDVSPDGRSFYFLNPRGQAQAGGAIRIVWADHWFRDIAARLAH